MKRVLLISLIIVIISCITIGIAFFSIPDRTVTIHIPYGASAHQVTGILRSEGLILSRTVFMISLRLAGGINRIKAGTYEFSTRTVIPAIINKLLHGKQVLTKFTIPEGLTITQTAELLASKGLGKAEEFLTIFKERHLEGYLLPETYIISQDFSPQQVIDTLGTQFERTFTKEWEAQTRKLGFTKFEIVILSSIIEKEAKADFERPLISAVFHNRLKARKYLESCATVQYALGKWKKRLSLKDLQIDSPYNTYKHFGLPPGPICSPGRKSFEAALFPAEKDWLFFVSNGDGTHTFYSSYRDHLKGKKEYQQMIREYKRRQRSKDYK